MTPLIVAVLSQFVRLVLRSEMNSKQRDVFPKLADNVGRNYEYTSRQRSLQYCELRTHATKWVCTGVLQLTSYVIEDISAVRTCGAISPPARTFAQSLWISGALVAKTRTNSETLDCQYQCRGGCTVTYASLAYSNSQYAFYAFSMGREALSRLPCSMFYDAQMINASLCNLCENTAIFLNRVVCIHSRVNT